MALPIDILEESFDLVAPRAEELVAHLYTRLFELAPETEALFAGTSMPDRYRTMLATLLLLRRSLSTMETVAPALRALGMRHERYGVRPEYYEPAGRALLESMAAIGGERWKSGYSDAWSLAWSVVRDTMLGRAARDGPD